jgi:hypothetical protein
VTHTFRRLWAVCCAEDVQQRAEDDAGHRRLERGIQALQSPSGGPCQATHFYQVGAHCNENPIYVFLFWELRGLSPNFPILSVSDSYIPRISSHISCSTTARSTVGIYIYHSQSHGNWDCGRPIPFMGIFVSNFQYWFFAVREEKACKVWYIDFNIFFRNERDLKDGKIVEKSLSNIKIKICFNFFRIGLKF